MNLLETYLLAVPILFVLIAATTTLYESRQRPAKNQLLQFWSLCIQMLMSTAAYWALVFVLALVASGAVWLILLLLIWVPSEWVKNFFDSNMLSDALQNIGPLINRSGNSPGITGIPLMDFVSLYCAFILSPVLGAWSIIVKDKSNRIPAGSVTTNENVPEQREASNSNV